MLTPLADYPALLLRLLDYTPPRQLRPHSGPVRGSGYAAAALSAEAQRVRDAPAGRRNDTLNAAAFSLGTLVGAGELDHDQVRAELLRAAEAIGLGDREAESAVNSGLRAGAAQPRERTA